MHSHINSTLIKYYGRRILQEYLCLLQFSLFNSSTHNVAMNDNIHVDSKMKNMMRLKSAKLGIVKERGLQHH